jgi:hypothetical protein
MLCLSLVSPLFCVSYGRWTPKIQKTIIYGKVKMWNCSLHVGEVKPQNRCNFWSWYKQHSTVADTHGSGQWVWGVTKEIHWTEERTISWNWWYSLTFFQERQKTAIYCIIFSRIPRLCVVVWLITLRGFWLDTGFIHYGDIQLQQITIAMNTIALTTATTTHLTYYCNSSKHWLPPSIIHCKHCTLQIPETHWRRLTLSTSKD